MKLGQFSQKKIITILHQAEKGEQTTLAICREHGITEPIFSRVLPCGWTPGNKVRLGGLEHFFCQSP